MGNPRTIAIAGFGLEGQSAYRYLKKLYPDAEFVVYDQKLSPKAKLPRGVLTRLGEEVDFRQIKADLIIRTPSIPPSRFASSARVTSVTNLFFGSCPAPIIGVTATKGKGTTCGLIVSILRAAGRRVHLLGNIGKPALDLLDKIKSTDIVVYELSSFQLWDIKYSPSVAVVGMIEPDHLDIHKNMDEYLTAKANIVRYQKSDNVVIYHFANQLAAQIATIGPAEKIRYGIRDDGGAYVKMNNFCVQGKVICSKNLLQLPGGHNVDNACAAITAALQFTRDFQAIGDGLKSFTGLRHRLKLVRELDGVRYYDDNYSTQPAATIAALKSFMGPKILIAGGYDKGADFRPMAKLIQSLGSVKQVLLIGQTAAKIEQALKAVGYRDFINAEGSSLKEVVLQAQSLAASGDIVLMSPACASFGMFKDYSDRGEQFIDIVEGLK